jgi:hydrogenase expression/formation protein HypC
VCLGIPGEILETHAGDLGLRMGTVRFGGAEREVCLAYVPEAEVGDYVIVHVGVAISQISEAEANEVFGYLKQIQALADLEEAEGPGAALRENRVAGGPAGGAGGAGPAA